MIRTVLYWRPKAAGRYEVPMAEDTVPGEGALFSIGRVAPGGAGDRAEKDPSPYKKKDSDTCY